MCAYLSTTIDDVCITPLSMASPDVLSTSVTISFMGFLPNGGDIPAAVAAARAVLADLDPKEVPARLRRLSASTARRLPPPMEKVLVGALDEMEWLRDKIELADDADDASVLFVNRPEGWVEELEQLTEAVQEERDVRKLAEASAELSRVSSERDVARERGKKLSAELEATKVDLKAVRAELSSRSAPTVIPDNAAEKRVSELEAELADLRGDLGSLEARLERTRADLLKARRAVPPSVSSESRGIGTDAAGLARAADALAQAARAEVAVADAVSPSSVQRDEVTMVVPVGVSPDSEEVVDTILARVDPTWLIVDGYNLSFHINPDGFTGTEGRKRVTDAMYGLQHRAVGKLKITVVWDSDQQNVLDDASVEAVFVADADEEVRRLSKLGEGPTVVVSSDKEVQDGVGKGVLVVWSEAVAGWIRRH